MCYISHNQPKNHLKLQYHTALKGYISHQYNILKTMKTITVMCASSESHPICTTNTTSQYFAIEGDYIKYSCEVTYAGKWAPVMIWRIGGKNATEVKNESTRNTVKFSIVVEITHSVNELQISCETKFDQPKPGTSSKNVYMYQSESLAL